MMTMSFPRGRDRGRLLVAIGCLAMLSACGYRFAGTGRLPDNVTRVCIHIFENRTSETGIEHMFANQLIDEFKRRNIVVTPTSEAADASLSGTIRALTVENISHLDQYASLERRVTVTVDVKFVAASGNVLNDFRGLKESETFDVAQGRKFMTEANQRRAVMTLAQRFSETVFKMISDDF